MIYKKHCHTIDRTYPHFLLRCYCDCNTFEISILLLLLRYLVLVKLWCTVDDGCRRYGWLASDDDGQWRHWPYLSAVPHVPRRWWRWSVWADDVSSTAADTQLSITGQSRHTPIDPQAEFFLDHRRLDKIYGCFSAEPKKCVIVNLRLKSHAVFNFFRPSRKASISKLTAVILCGWNISFLANVLSG